MLWPIVITFQLVCVHRYKTKGGWFHPPLWGLDAEVNLMDQRLCCHSDPEQWDSQVSLLPFVHVWVCIYSISNVCVSIFDLCIWVLHVFLSLVPDDLSPEERQELESIRRRKQELLQDIQVITHTLLPYTTYISLINLLNFHLEFNFLGPPSVLSSYCLDKMFSQQGNHEREVCFCPCCKTLRLSGSLKSLSL